MADLRGYVEGLIGFEGDGTNVEANPTGTPTDTLETIQIGDVIYNVNGSSEDIVPTPTNTDRGKLLGVKSNANELEYREVREVPNTTGVELGNVLTRTVTGYMWSAPEKELPPYTAEDNNKVLGIVNGGLNWLEQSGGGGGVNYSTEEQDTGLKWIDNRAIYQRTIYILNPVSDARTTINILLGADRIISFEGAIDRNVQGLGSIVYPINTFESNDYYCQVVYDKYVDKLAYNIHFVYDSISDLIITVRYIKSSS